MKPENLQKTGIYLFKLFGFEVRLDWSWFFLAFLVIWTLAVGYFPLNFKGLGVVTYWIMGIIGALGLFLSIILHELCHSLVGRKYGLPIAGIKLFIFGGIAQMHGEPPNPKAEFLMAIAGPAFSLSAGIAFFILFNAGINLKWPMPILGVINYLGVINIIVAIFNMLPGFPLDGGRVLRSILWWYKQDLMWATRIASSFGTGMGYTLIFLGIVFIVQGIFISGLWFFLIGFFLQNIAKMSYRQLIIEEIFQNAIISDYCKSKPIAVSPNITIHQLVNDYFYKYFHKLYPVIENNKLIGYISFDEIRQQPQHKWFDLRVHDIMKPCTSDILIDANTKIISVLQKVSAQQRSRFIVTKNNQLYGVITLKDLMDIVSIKIGFEQHNGD